VTEEKALVKLTKTITEESPDVASLGVIIGAMSGDVKALEKLKKEAGSVEDFLAQAGDLANVALVAAATKAAIGHTFEEVTTEIKRFVDGYNSDGTVRVRDVPVGEKRRTKYILPSESILKFLLSNRLPQYFSDTKKVEINKRIIEIKGNAEEEIRKFAGNLLESLDVEVIETTFEEKKND
jgi:hypothetical protein